MTSEALGKPLTRRKNANVEYVKNRKLDNEVSRGQDQSKWRTFVEGVRTFNKTSFSVHQRITILN